MTQVGGFDPDEFDPTARPYAAAGVLFFDDEDRVLLVTTTYKPGMEIPGGMVQPGETPAEAAVREVREELGITPPIGPLLVVDWAPTPHQGDKVLFVFDGGRLGPAHRDRIVPDPREIAGYAFHDPASVGTLVVARLARRVAAAIEARASGQTSYLEYGRVFGGSA
jgi:8-oxo-dGTP pyrophosphatase MutT (NUDIX family)